MSRYLPIFLGILTTLSYAADPVEVKAPYLEVGDCWTYSAKGINRNGPIESYRECITHIDSQKNVLLALAVTQPAGMEIETSYTLQWGEIASIAGLITRPPVEWLSFPLRIGDSYDRAWWWLNRFYGENRTGENKAKAKINDWEDITVAAGKFRALRIDVVGNYKNTGSGIAHFWFRTFWYSPEVKRIVKSVFRISDSTYQDYSEIELIKVELIP